MRFTNIKSLASVVLASALIAFAGGATAATISGDLSFSGDVSFDTGDLATATTLTFPGGDIDADGSNGDFGGISLGDIGTIDTLAFSPFTSSGFSIGGFDFTLNTLAVVFQSSATVLMEGSGTVIGAGFDATGFTYTASATDIGPLQNMSLTLTTGDMVVPVPGALILLASALGVLGIRRR